VSIQQRPLVNKTVFCIGSMTVLLSQVDLYT